MQTKMVNLHNTPPRCLGILPLRLALYSPYKFPP